MLAHQTVNPRPRTALFLVPLLAAIALAGCGGGDSTNAVAEETGSAEPASKTVARQRSITSEDVVAAFANAKLEAESPTRIPPNDFGIAPVVTDDATRFLIPSMGEDSGGRAFVIEETADLRKMKAAYDDLGKENGLLFSWTFANEEVGVLVQINGDLPEPKAKLYENVVAGL